MTTPDLDVAFGIISSHPDKADFDSGASQADIVEAESRLGLSFSDDYRLFLERFGCGSIFGLEVSGIVRGRLDATGIPNAIWHTKTCRNKMSLPEKYLVISETGDGGLYCLDCSPQNSDGRGSVVMLFPDASQPKFSFERVAESFGEFLRKQLQSRLHA